MAKTKSKPSARPSKISGQTALADALGVSQQRVSELMRDPDWRWPRKSWSSDHVHEISSWLNRRRSENNATADEISDDAAADVLGSLKRDPVKVAKLKKLIEETTLIKLNRQLKEGNYILKSEVQEERTMRIEAVKLKMQQIPLRAKDVQAMFHAAIVRQLNDHELIRRMEEGLEGRIEAMLTHWMKEICNAFARGE